ncbi:MAG TPA: hypothetical protein VFM10_03015, partial [Terriglobales bacterium]|nr:hypothetical protein [Terriglobales bacterium]
MEFAVPHNRNRTQSNERFQFASSTFCGIPNFAAALVIALAWESELKIILLALIMTSSLFAQKA